ncbi:unnamed protein product [Nesidiocoris tenuis]|uniref:Uncharacterized protein n=1 Tax=Nesidiocoris tenuis TaxID=355587 RepID=A0A6H5GKK8_9HEMI|nr:unnamed protein product [Nesidiocoris tenuis]
MPLEDSLECRQPGSRGAAEGAAGELEGGGRRSPCSGGRVGESSSDSSSPPGGRRFTSLVMITQENGPSSAAPMTSTRLDDNKATSMCLEEGLADDDSWVEDLDREEIVTTTEESSEDDGPYPDREEELRGYHRSAIDFTLHTIAEESCEESEVENDLKRPTELEKYFFYGLGGVTNGTNGDKIDVGDSVVDFDEDAMSETSSIFSEGVDSNVSATEDETSTKNHLEPSELASSRLEKYFLSGFMGFRRDSDGSVGSDSEGRPSPEQRRKRLVRARGTGRSSHSTSLDNLLVEQPSGGEQAETVVNDAGGDGSSTETDSHDELVTSFDKADGQFDTVKRSANQTTSTTKKKKRSVPSCDEMTSNVDHVSTDDSGGNKTPQPMSESDLLRTKQQSRDSGFVGSCDDLLKESRSSETEDRKTDEGGTGEEKSTTTKTSTMSPTTAPSAGLIRKDSFNNWSSDEETNLMMSKMRAFFKTMVGSSTTKASPDSARPKKPPQLVYFESELTRLMKTVPGLKDEQVREIVEYLSSEDTWSDSYDSSDYTSSDLENSTKRSALQEEISASCRQIISNFESPSSHDDQDGDQDLVYQRLVASFNRIEQAKNITTTATKTTSSQNSPLLIEKVMSHIGTRLWALMHEVSGENQYPIKRLSSKISTTTEEEEDDEVATVDDYADVAALPRSKSHDPLLEELGRHEAASDNERFSWRGSFESALMAASDSRTRLVSAGDSCASSASALAAKRRSAGDLIAANCSSREQLDRVRSCGSIGAAADEKIWPRRRRRSSVPDSCDDSDDESAGAGGHRATLPRSLQSSSNTTNSLPRLPLATGAPIYKSHSVNQFGVKSARYRPPGYRGNQVPPPPPVRRDRNKRHNSMSSTSTAANAGESKFFTITTFFILFIDKKLFSIISKSSLNVFENSPINLQNRSNSRSSDTPSEIGRIVYPGGWRGFSGTADCGFCAVYASAVIRNGTEGMGPEESAPSTARQHYGHFYPNFCPKIENQGIRKNFHFFTFTQNDFLNQGLLKSKGFKNEQLSKKKNLYPNFKSEQESNSRYNRRSCEEVTLKKLLELNMWQTVAQLYSAYRLSHT